MQPAGGPGTVAHHSTRATIKLEHWKYDVELKEGTESSATRYKLHTTADAMNGSLILKYGLLLVYQPSKSAIEMAKTQYKFKVIGL